MTFSLRNALCKNFENKNKFMACQSKNSSEATKVNFDLRETYTDSDIQ